MSAFIKYEGIDGECDDANHVKWIDMLSLDWSIHMRSPRLKGQSRRRD